MLKDFTCAWCGSVFQKYEAQVKRPALAFCCRACVNSFQDKTKNPGHYKEYANHDKVSARMSEMNRTMNAQRMTDETRQKLSDTRKAMFDGCVGYEKTFGRHVHRIVAEQMLGRPLLSSEVVHHVDGDKRNNTPENLMIFSSQSEHVKWHRNNDPKWKKGGDAK